VGKSHFVELTEVEMRSWAETKWRSLLCYMPMVVRLLSGCYNFHFLSQDDLTKIKAIPWIKGRSFLALHSSYVGFNPLKEMQQNKLIWVKLHGFPIEFWTQEVFMDIGNAIGKLFMSTRGVWVHKIRELHGSLSKRNTEEDSWTTLNYNGRAPT